MDNVNGYSKLYISKSNLDIIYTYDIYGNGIFRSIDGGIEWKKISDSNFYLGEINAGDPSILYGSYNSTDMESYFFFSTDSGKTWTWSKTAQIIWSYLIKSSPNPPYAVYTDAPPEDSSNCMLSVSYDTCKTWQCIGAPNSVTSLVFTEGSDSLLYIGTYHKGVYRSIDKGGNWDSLGLGGLTGENHIAINPEDQNIIYSAIYDHGVYKTTDNGSNWIEINNGLISNKITNFIMNHENPLHLFIGTEDKGLFFSLDGGESWDPLEKSQDGECIYGMALDERTEKLYFSNQYGVYTVENIFTYIKDENIVQSQDIILNQNYPNPFNSSTTIFYSLPKTMRFSIKIYNLLGQEVKTLYSGQKQAGKHKLNFNANDLASGIYIYRLQTDKFCTSKKLLLLK